MILGLAWRVWRRESRVDAAWAGAPAVGLGVLCGYVALVGSPPVPFGERVLSAEQWLAWMLALATVAFTLDAFGRAQTLRTWGVRIALALLLLLTVLGTKLRHAWSGSEAAAWIAGLATGLCLLLAASEALARRRPGAAIPFVLGLPAVGLSVALVLGGSAFLAQLAGAVASTLGAAFVLAWWRPRLAFARGAAAIAILALFGVGLCGTFYNDLEPRAALCCAAAPLTAWVAELLPARRAARARLVRLVAVALPVAVALGLAALAYEPSAY